MLSKKFGGMQLGEMPTPFYNKKYRYK